MYYRKDGASCLCIHWLPVARVANGKCEINLQCNVVKVIVGGFIVEKVIYEKKYPKESTEELQVLQDRCGEPTVPFEKFFKQLCEDLVYILIPSRQEAAGEFIRVAREISEQYQIDIKITQHTGNICVDLYFNSGCRIQYLKDIIVLADDIGLFANIFGYEIVLSLDFYTRAVYLRGRQIMP